VDWSTHPIRGVCTGTFAKARRRLCRPLRSVRDKSAIPDPYTFLTPKSQKKQKSTRRANAGAGAGTVLGPAPGENSLTIASPLRMSEMRVKLTQSTTVDFSSGGVGTIVMLRNPSGAPKFSPLAAIYDEFKVNGMRFRINFPKYVSLGDGPAGSAPTGIVTDFPSACVAAYDNDQITAVSFATLCGYEKPHFTSAEGHVSFGLTNLPKTSVAGSTVVGGSLATAEWVDTAFASNVYGMICVAIDRNYAGTWGVSPPVFASITYTREWDVSFRGKASA